MLLLAMAAPRAVGQGVLPAGGGGAVDLWAGGLWQEVGVASVCRCAEPGGRRLRGLSREEGWVAGG